MTTTTTMTTTTMTTTTTTTTTNVLNYSAASCGGHFKNLHLKLLHSSTQTSADRQSGQQSAVWLTEKLRLGLPSECQKWGAGPSFWWQTVPCLRCSYRKGAVATREGSRTSRRHLQCHGVSRASKQAFLFAQLINIHIISMNNVQGQAARKAHKAQHCWPPCKKILN